MNGYISPQGSLFKCRGKDVYKWSIDTCKRIGVCFECGFDCMKYLLDNGYIEIRDESVWWGEGFVPTKEQVDFIIDNKNKLTEMQHTLLYDVIAKYGDMKLLNKFLDK